MMKNPRKLIILTAAAVSFGVGADTAAAQVFIDPGSPSAKEYGIPLEDVRRQSSGESDAPVTQGERSATLFGEGIGDDEASSAPATASSGGGGSGKDSGKSDAPATGPGGSGPGAEASSSTERALAGTTQPVGAAIPQGGFGSASTIGALALSVLLLGGVIGSIARRRTS